MTHPFDANLMFYTEKDVTQSESAGAVLQVWGQVDKGLAARIICEDAFGANDTVLPKVYLSTDGSTYNLVAQARQGAVKPKGGYEWMIPFPCAPGKNYVKLELIVTAASTTMTLTDVVAGIVPNVGGVFDRTNHFE